LAQVKDTPLVQTPAAAAAQPTVPAETADCTRMPEGSQKSDCLRQHPYTGRMLLPDEKRPAGTAPADGAATK
jgi:hypothetical protein